MPASAPKTSTTSSKATISKGSDKPNTRQQIIDFAADQLRQKGLEGFSFLDIARFMGISKASVHHHFPKKVDLAMALCDWTEQWLQQGLEHFSKHGTGSWDKLQRYIRAAKRNALDDNKMCPISALHTDLHKLPDEVKERLAELDRYELAWVAGVIADGIKSDEFKTQDQNSDIDQSAEALASLFIFSIKGALYHARLHGDTRLQQTLGQIEKIFSISQ